MTEQEYQCRMRITAQLQATSEMTLIQLLRAAYDRIQKDPPKPRDNELLNEILKAIIVEELKGG